MKKSFHLKTFLLFCLIGLFFVLIFLFVLPPVIGGQSGDTGIKVMSQNCLGLKIKESGLTKVFSPGYNTFYLLQTHFVYAVPEKSPFSTNSGSDPLYCVGIDIWN